MVWSMTVIWCYIQIIQIWPSQWRKSGLLKNKWIMISTLIKHDLSMLLSMLDGNWFPKFKSLIHPSQPSAAAADISELLDFHLGHFHNDFLVHHLRHFHRLFDLLWCGQHNSSHHGEILGIWFPLTWRSNRNEALQIHRSIMIHRSRVNQPFVWVWLCDFIFLANLCRWKSWCANITKPRCVLDDLLGDLLFHIFHLQNPWPKWQGNGRWQRRVVDMSSLSRHLHFGNLSYHFADFHFGHLPHTRKTRSGCWKNVLANRIKLGWRWWYGTDFLLCFSPCSKQESFQLARCQPNDNFHHVWCLMLPVVPARGGAEVALKIYIKPFSSIELACAVRQPSPCVRALCESGVLFHMSHLKLHFTLHTRQSSHSRLHTSHCTLRSPHFTVHTSHFTLHTSHFHTSHFTLHTSHCTLLAPHFTLHPSSHLSSTHLIAKVEKIC